jgi:succinyl-CoA synthetase beta subunit
MDLLEHQGKELFRRYGVPTAPPGGVATDAAEAERIASELALPVVVKAQVHAGGRGKAGGVKVCSSVAEVRGAAEGILGMQIKGHTVDAVLVEPGTEIAEEYYLSLLHDRVSKGYKIIASVEGGVEIEEINRTSPEKVIKADIDPTKGLDAARAREVMAEAGVPEAVRDDAAALLGKLYSGFVDADATLFEINPLVRTSDDRVIALDSKVTIDNNALFRHEDLAEWRSDSAGDPLEAEAKQKGLQYVRLEGSVGVLGNGAGLVMSTLDGVSAAGGSPANFLDVGGGADADKMAESLSLVLSDPQVRSVLVNIFGGITRCDEIANGVLAALNKLDDVPQMLVVRLDGTNAEEGRKILQQADHPNVEPAKHMGEAAQRAVALAR